MQTFLPFADFKKSAKVLDWQRLNKQRSEGKVILEIIQGLKPKSRWRNHTAVRMWKGYDNALAYYTNCIIEEWVDRGYRNNMKLYQYNSPIELPWWLGLEKFHSAHRSKLLFKNYEHYQQFGWKEPNNLEYFWPV